MGELSRLILKNSSLNAARTVVVSGLTLAATPVILRMLGTEQYGIWALVVAFASYANFLELGFNSAVTRLVASQNKSPLSPLNKGGNQEKPILGAPLDKGGWGDNSVVAAQINSTVITYMIVSAAVFTFAAIFLQPIKSLLFRNISVPHLEPMLLGTLACFLMNLTTSNFLSVLSGRMRMDLTNLIAILTNLVQSFGAVALLFFGYGLPGVFAASAASSVLGSCLAVGLAKKEYPSLFFDPRQYHFSSIRGLFKFSLKMYFVNTSGNFITATNKFLIARLSGLNYVAYYEIGWKIVNQLRVFFQNILEPVFPAAAVVVSRWARPQPLRTFSAYEKTFKYLLLTSLPAYCAMFLLIYPFVFLWLGEKYVQIGLIVIIIGVSNLINLQTAAGFYFLASQNRLHSAVTSAMLSLAGNFGLGFAGWFLFGFFGMLTGFSLGQTIPSLWFIWASKREMLFCSIDKDQ